MGYIQWTINGQRPVMGLPEVVADRLDWPLLSQKLRGFSLIYALQIQPPLLMSLQAASDPQQKALKQVQIAEVRKVAEGLKTLGAGDTMVQIEDEDEFIKNIFGRQDLTVY